MKQSSLTAALRRGRDELSTAGIANATGEAHTLMQFVLGVEPSQLARKKLLDDELCEAQAQEFRVLIRQRSQRVPLQHLTGEAWFYGHRIIVEPGVFIPRVETELLVEEVLKTLDARQIHSPKIMDLCSGTGAIICALGAELQDSTTLPELWAVELTDQAVALTSKNAQELCQELKVVQGDATQVTGLAESSPELQKSMGEFDVVVSNPPYIPETRPVTQLEAQLDPETALYGGSADGTAIPRGVIASATQLLSPGGLFVMEHDDDHQHALIEYMRSTGDWIEVSAHRDLAQKDRYIRAVRAPHMTPTANYEEQVAQ